jgi:hypothetical protein
MWSTELGNLPGFSFSLPPVFQAFAENQVVQSKETLQTLSTAVQEACSTGVRGLNECNQMIMEAGHENADAAYDCCRALIAAKSMPELVDVWTRRAPGHINSITNRAGDLWALYWKVTTDAAKPITAGMPHALGRSKQA